MSTNKSDYDQICECGEIVMSIVKTELIFRVSYVFWCPNCGTIIKAEKSGKQWTLEEPLEPKMLKEFSKKI